MNATLQCLSQITELREGLRFFGTDNANMLIHVEPVPKSNSRDEGSFKVKVSKGDHIFSINHDEFSDDGASTSQTNDESIEETNDPLRVDGVLDASSDLGSNGYNEIQYELEAVSEQVQLYDKPSFVLNNTSLDISTEPEIGRDDNNRDENSDSVVEPEQNLSTTLTLTSCDEIPPTDEPILWDDSDPSNVSPLQYDQDWGILSAAKNSKSSQDFSLGLPTRDDMGGGSRDDSVLSDAEATKGSDSEELDDENIEDEGVEASPLEDDDNVDNSTTSSESSKPEPELINGEGDNGGRQRRYSKKEKETREEKEIQEFIRKEQSKPLHLKLSIPDSSITTKLYELFEQMTDNRRPGKVVNPSAVHNLMRKNFRAGQQHDAHELLRSIIDMLKKDVIKGMRKALIREYIGDEYLEERNSKKNNGRANLRTENDEVNRVPLKVRKLVRLSLLLPKF